MSQSPQQTVRGALACVGRRPTILSVASHSVAPRVRSPGPKSCPETGSFDRLVFFAPGRLVWVSWLVRRRRSYAIRSWRCGLHAVVGLFASIRSVSGERFTRGPTSICGLPRPMGAASVRLPHAQLVSCCAVSVQAHGDRCRAYLVRTLRMRVLCDGRPRFFRSRR